MPTTQKKWLFYWFCVWLWNSEEAISHIIRDLRYSKVGTRWWTPFYPRLSQQMKPGSLFWNQRQKGAGKWVVPRGHTRTCFLFAQACRSGQRLCEKIGFRDKPSPLNRCYFHNFWINIYCRKKHLILLSEQPLYNNQLYGAESLLRS
jgi:hypothetical protein